jgi:hypothetical protein
MKGTVAVLSVGVLLAVPLGVRAGPKEGSLDLLEKKVYADAGGKKLPHRLLSR